MLKHLVRVVIAASLASVLPPPALFAQPKLPATAETPASEFNVAQLDAMLAPIALYPDELLTQLLMATTYPLQIVAAARWLEKGDNKKLKGDALVKALEQENWDPSVKSLLPFPQIVAMLNDKLEWTQQLGYAVASQQAAVLDSIQRLRRQAQKAGSLKTTEQQRVVMNDETVVIEPAQPEIVYVPVYQPANVYGDWPYADNPPVYIPPPEAYYPQAYAPGYVWGAGLAFAAGAAVVGRLWGWARPRWGHGNVNIETARFNNINVNRGQINSGIWRPPAGGAVGRPVRPPGGPVGLPARPTQLPANAIGRGNVQVPGSAVNRPQIPVRVGGAGSVQRPSIVQGSAAARTPSVLRGSSPSVLRGGSPSAVQRPAGAFGGVGDGARAGQFGARGAQSRGFQQGAAARGGGGFQARGGGGAVRGGGAARGGGRR